MALIAKRQAIRDIKSALRKIFIRLDVMSMKFNILDSAFLASCFVPTENRIDPFVMGTAAIPASSFFSIVVMVLTKIPKSTFVGAGLRTKLLLPKYRNALGLPFREQLAA